MSAVLHRERVVNWSHLSNERKLVFKMVYNRIQHSMLRVNPEVDLPQMSSAYHRQRVWNLSQLLNEITLEF